MRISDLSADVCSSDLADHRLQRVIAGAQRVVLRIEERQHPVLLVVVQELPDDRPRCQPGGDPQGELQPAPDDRKSVGKGRRVPDRVVRGGRRIITQQSELTMRGLSVRQNKKKLSKTKN